MHAFVTGMCYERPLRQAVLSPPGVAFLRFNESFAVEVSASGSGGLIGVKDSWHLNVSDAIDGTQLVCPLCLGFFFLELTRCSQQLCLYMFGTTTWANCASFNNTVPSGLYGFELRSLAGSEWRLSLYFNRSRLTLSSPCLYPTHDVYRVGTWSWGAEVRPVSTPSQAYLHLGGHSTSFFSGTIHDFAVLRGLSDVSGQEYDTAWWALIERCLLNFMQAPSTQRRTGWLKRVAIREWPASRKALVSRSARRAPAMTSVSACEVSARTMFAAFCYPCDMKYDAQALQASRALVV